MSTDGVAEPCGARLPLAGAEMVVRLAVTAMAAAAERAETRRRDVLGTVGAFRWGHVEVTLPARDPPVNRTRATGTVTLPVSRGPIHTGGGWGEGPLTPT